MSEDHQEVLLCGPLDLPNSTRSMDHLASENALWIVWTKTSIMRKVIHQKMNNCYSTCADISSKLPLQWVEYTALKKMDWMDPCDNSVPHVLFVYFFVRNALKMCIIIR